MTNIFIAFTPYHVLLSQSIALKHQPENNYLFIISDFSETNKITQSFKSLEKTPFLKIISLPGVYAKKNIFKKRFIIRQNIIKIKRFVNKIKIDNVYIFHDGRAEAQVALYYTKKNYKNSKGIYIEDGAGAYSSYFSKKRGKLKLLIGKFFYGWWWEDVNILGTSRWIDQVMAIFPNLVRPELKVKKITALRKQDFLRIKEGKFLSRYIQLSGLDTKTLQQIDALLIIAHSEFAQRYSNYKETIEKIFKIIKNQGLKTAVKYHPREPWEDFLSICDKEETIISPKALPVEVLYILSPQSLKLIIGDISTSLLTAKWLLGKTKVISIAPWLNYYDHILFETFRKINVQLINNEENFKTFINGL